MAEDFTIKIDTLTEELSTEEQALLNELDAKMLLKIPGCRTAEHIDADARRTKILKTLVYKDLVTFSIDHNLPGYYVFVSRKSLGRF
jgi:hypothetical protein